MEGTPTYASAGGIVLGDAGMLAIVKSKNGNGCFFFPKGHLHEGEDDESAARREIEEETGLGNLERIADLGVYMRPSIKRSGVTKPIHFFLFAAPSHATLSPGEEISEARWVHYQKAAESFEYDKDRAWYITVFERVKEAIQRD